MSKFTIAERRRALLLLCLHYHQGGSSPIGQPIRKELGMGQYGRIDQETLRWAGNVVDGLESGTIPPGVFCDPQDYNFYDAITGDEMDTLFHSRWIAHVDRFPWSKDAAVSETKLASLRRDLGSANAALKLIGGALRLPAGADLHVECPPGVAQLRKAVAALETAQSGWREVMRDLLPEKIQDVECDECGGDEAQCPGECAIRRGIALLDGGPAADFDAERIRLEGEFQAAGEQLLAFMGADNVRIGRGSFGEFRPEWNAVADPVHWTPLKASAWRDAVADPPPDREFVLVACKSGYTTAPIEYATARLDREYRGDAWIGVSNDRLSDRGLSPLWWMPLPTAPADKPMGTLPPASGSNIETEK